MNIALINTNRIQPPIAPIALDYIAEALASAGHGIDILDLCWVDDVSTAITSFFEGKNHRLVAVTFRNTDDCALVNSQSFIPDLVDIIQRIRQSTDASVIVGGCGFSVIPEPIVQASHPDAGVWGEGEFVLSQIADRIERGEDWHDLPDLIYEVDGSVRRNPSTEWPLESLPAMSRRWVDNQQYFLCGGQAGIETKRGCPCSCIYCADPVAKGRRTRLRPPETIVQELQNLVEQDIDHIHTCDSEFNIPISHALEVCRAIVDARLGNRLRWYAYCAPAPFTAELARLMKEAGCVGINFGVDSGDNDILKRLGRDFCADDILSAAAACKRNGIAVMFDMLFGSPGETAQSLRRSIEVARQADPLRVGINFGLGIFPGTEVDRRVQAGEISEGLSGGDSRTDPRFFVEPAIADSYTDIVEPLVEGDDRFLFFDPNKPDANYNYNANQRLVDAIAQGHRGAYWHILAEL